MKVYLSGGKHFQSYYPSDILGANASMPPWMPSHNRFDPNHNPFDPTMQINANQFSWNISIAFLNLLYRRLSKNRSWWPPMATQLLCFCPKSDQLLFRFRSGWRLSGRGSCKQLRCKEIVCQQWGEGPSQVLRELFLVIWWPKVSSACRA